MGARKIMQLQCDLSVMISNELYKEFIVDELETTSSWLDHAMYHLDGMEQIRHLDDILSVPGIHMIQWTQVAGQPPVEQFIPQLKKIQQAGKGIVLVIFQKQVQPLLETCRRRAESGCDGCKSPDEADRIVALAERLSK